MRFEWTSLIITCFISSNHSIELLTWQTPMYLGYVSIISQSHIICTTSHSNRLGLYVKYWDTWVIFGPAFTHYPLFQWYPQSKEILLNLSMKCWNSAFNAQGSRVIIVVVQVGAVKIFVAAVEALRIKERQDEAQFITKFVGKTSLGPSHFAVVKSYLLFCRILHLSHTISPPIQPPDNAQALRKL